MLARQIRLLTGLYKVSSAALSTTAPAFNHKNDSIIMVEGKAIAIRLDETERKTIEDYLGRKKLPDVVIVMTLSGVPVEHQMDRTARVYMPARSATQAAWGQTGMWKIELDNQERWENHLMGWTSSGDPLSNISGALSFATKDDAIRFCMKNKWNYEVEEPKERKILPKTYGQNFSWNKRTRVSTK